MLHRFLQLFHAVGCDAGPSANLVGQIVPSLQEAVPLLYQADLYDSSTSHDIGRRCTEKTLSSLETQVSPLSNRRFSNPGPSIFLTPSPPNSFRSHSATYPFYSFCSAKGKLSQIFENVLQNARPCLVAMKFVFAQFARMPIKMSRERKFYFSVDPCSATASQWNRTIWSGLVWEGHLALIRLKRNWDFDFAN